MRTRWSHLLDRPHEVQTAYALESVLDEAVFVVGPVLATMLATLWHPVAGLVVAAVAGLVGTYAFAAQRATEPPSGLHRRGARPAARCRGAPCCRSPWSACRWAPSSAPPR